MRSALFSASAIAVALALPIAAQAAPNPSSAADAPSTTSPATTAPSATTTPDSSPSPSKMSTHGRLDRNVIRADLKKAGFTNIRVMPVAFVARATDKQGHPVLMAFRPHSFEAVTELKSASSSHSTTQNNDRTTK